MNRKVLDLVLRPLNVDNRFVENGALALDAYRADPDSFDVILMDIMMPQMNGLDATRAIRTYEEENNLPRTPIIAISANALPSDFDASVDAGCDMHIAKPYDPEDIYAAIQRCLGQMKAA